MSQTTITDPSQIKASPVDLTDDEIAYSMILDECGGDVEKAAKIRAISSISAGAVERRREKLQAEKQAQLEAAWHASPAGRKYAAEKALEERAARRNLVEGARELLGQDERYSAEDIEALGDDEALSLSGIVPDEAELRRREDARLLSDPEAMRNHEQKREKPRILSGWFFHGEEYNRQECAQYGLDYDELSEIAWKRWNERIT